MEVIPWKKRKSKGFMNFWNVQNVNKTQKRRQLCDGQYSNLKADRRSKSAFFACFSFLRGLLWIYLYNRKCETINAIQVRPYIEGLDRLWWNYDSIQAGGPVPLIFSSAIKIPQIRKTCQKPGIKFDSEKITGRI